MQLRDYQQDLENRIYNSWNTGHKSPLVVSPTGSGKTVIMSSILKAHDGYSCPIAHRQELVIQLCNTLARNEVYHSIIASDKVVKLCVNSQMAEFGKTFYHRNAPVLTSSVDTLIRRDLGAKEVTLRVNDEAHHCLHNNKWGKAIAMLPKAKGLGFTATPTRTDKQPLRSCFDDLIVGESMRSLISRGMLSDYRIYGAPSAIQEARVKISKTTGDFSQNSLIEETKKSGIIGDVVTSYLKIARGKLGITFAVDVENATDIAKAFCENGVPAAVVSAKTPTNIRQQLMDKFRNRQLLQIVNVDLIGEGVDIPAVEVVSMARATMSFGLYVQQFGRALRLSEGKTHGIIIDHVGNVVRHGLPDAEREWSLDDTGGKGKSDDIIPLTSCTNPECLMVFKRIYKNCPHCGHARDNPIKSSNPIEIIEGDLLEYDLELLSKLRGEADRIIGDPQIPHNASQVVQASIVKKWNIRCEAQKELRKCIAFWAALNDHNGDYSVMYRKFYFMFGIDVATAKTLNANDSLKLATEIRKTFN